MCWISGDLNSREPQPLSFVRQAALAHLRGVEGTAAMTAKPLHPEISAYAAGAAVGAVAMLLVLLPHTRFDVAAAPARVSSTQADTLQAPVPGQSLYAAAKIGLPPGD
jgi:hypothetical protein